MLYLPDVRKVVLNNLINLTLKHQAHSKVLLTRDKISTMAKVLLLVEWVKIRFALQPGLMTVKHLIS